jgi:hypothetical protein
MQQWEYLLLAVSINAWQKPAPDIAVIDASGQMTRYTFPAFHSYVNGLGEQGWHLAHIEEHCWVFKRPKQEAA